MNANNLVSKVAILIKLKKTDIGEIVRWSSHSNIEMLIFAAFTADHRTRLLQSHLLTRELEVDKNFNEAVVRLNERKEHQDNMTSYFSSIKSDSKPLRATKKDMKRLEAVRRALRRPMR